MAVGGASTACIIVCLIRLVTERQKKQNANVSGNPLDGGRMNTDALHLGTFRITTKRNVGENVDAIIGNRKRPTKCMVKSYEFVQTPAT